jgi:hypothetical protein
LQVAPTPPPCSVLSGLQRETLRPQPTAKPPADSEESTACTREQSPGSTTPSPLQSSTKTSPLRCVREAVRFIATQGGVAFLPAVANLTVKTNIRTARRGTLRGARDSPTMQANLRGCGACESLAANRVYVPLRKIRQNFPSVSTMPEKSAEQAWVIAVVLLVVLLRSLRRVSPPTNGIAVIRSPGLYLWTKLGLKSGMNRSERRSYQSSYSSPPRSKSNSPRLGAESSSVAF